MELKSSRAAITLAVITAALGFFVDAYDLLLYSIVRNQSLIDIGLSGDRLLSVGIDLLNAQLVGMLVGGIVWGILGDIYGRRSVLFGSIILYSVATFANGFADTVPVYAVCRFAAGLGLAGELGAGITLVSELMSKENRGYGTMIVAAVGVLGVVTASLVGDRFPWRTAYFIGGGLGFLLLLLRLGVRESVLFDRVRTAAVSRGNFLALFTNAGRLKKYACLILVAMPIWYWAVFVTVAAEQFGTNLRATVAVTAPNFVRGLTAALTIGFKSLKGSLGTVPTAALIGAVTILVAFIALHQLEETYGKDLDYTEPV